MEDTKLLYSEVLGVLLALGNKYVEKTPSKIIDYLKNNCDYNSIPKIDKNIRIENQNISEDSKIFLAILKLNYWCESEEEKKEIYKILKDNEDYYNKQLEEKFKFSEVMINNDAKDDIQKNENIGIIEKKQTKWYEKIISFFKNVFKKNK